MKRRYVAAAIMLVFIAHHRASAQSVPPSQITPRPGVTMTDHETIIRLNAILQDIGQRYDDERGKSIICAANLGAETDKLNQQITLTQTAEAALKKIDAEQDDEQDAEEETTR